MTKQAEDYYRAYLREKQARDELEHLLEEKTRALYESNQALEEKILQLQNQQAVLMQAEKMATLGTLSAGVAHEINNPLAYAMSNLESLNYVKPVLGGLLSVSKDFIAKEISNDDFITELKRLNQQQSFGFLITDMDELLDDAQDGLRRIGAIVKNLLSFARPKNNLLAMADISKSLESGLKLLNNQLKNTHLICHVQPIPLSYCNLATLNQVIVNLLLNAKQACDGREQKAEIVVKLFSERSFIYLSVEDNGCGMSEETIKRIFDPFFTTKPVGQGTGMGMSIVYSIIQEHQGRVLIDSTVGAGSKVVCELPILEETDE
ncbi:Sporulation kinase E [Pseudoalteromonas holothuriae]|uniref:histidine kinase n=1 Tax=Pseudoalteromonas holothuriae TaxID=2963714 RepID=A0A9W4QU04_9GAMM|nr:MULTISPECIES: ATP-binding protein [unclassified Pseudoalteromonas]CAH9053183.1 Sporulation kinase E [Pseudoalteromonas sp. CIP111854]CAH9061597.1 Sporulation kinase E [Pseudoalteromonas sp. CIP111951]